MPSTFTYQFDTASYKGSTTFNTGLFIGGKFVDPVDPGTIEVVNPTNGKTITSVQAGTVKDVDLAVAAAKKAYKSSWGLRVPPGQRGALLDNLANLIQKHNDELSALESLNTGKTYSFTHGREIGMSVAILKYFAGWADKHHGKTVESSEAKLAYTRNEPLGVVGAITPWNFPLFMVISKLAPALATGNTVVVKPSELTPLTALRLADLITEAGFPPGVVNIVNGYGNTVGQAISEHMGIQKVSFTGSTLTGRRIMVAGAESNLKDVCLELGGKSPNIIFDDADLDQAVKWASQGIFFNKGEACIAGSRIFVQEGIYDAFLAKFTELAKSIKLGDPFVDSTVQGPQVSKMAFDRVMGYIESGKADKATVHLGGAQHGTEGYFVEPTIFTGCKQDMKIVKEEIFGPVAAIMTFKDEEEVIEKANDTVYGLACAVFSENIGRALRVAHALEAGSAYVNCFGLSDFGMPFGGYKQSGIGREMGEYALEQYTAVKAVHVNIGIRI